MPDVVFNYRPEALRTFRAGARFNLPLASVAGEQMALVYAHASADGAQIFAVFSNQLETTRATDPTNYTLTPDVGSSGRSVVSASILGTHAVALTLDDPLSSGTNNYLLTVGNGITTGVRDSLGRVIQSTRRTYDISGPVAEAPELTIAVVAVDSTHFRITFSAPVLDTPALRSLDNYETDPELELYAIAPEGVASPNYVDVTCSEQREGLSYSVIIHQIEAA